MADISQIKLPNNTTLDLKDAKKKGVYFVKGTQTAATGAWTGNIDIPELYTGLTIMYYLPYGGSGNATLNLTLSDGTTTGAKNCYITTSRLTTHYGAGRNILMTFYKAGDISINGNATTDDRWICDAYYDSNDHYYLRRLQSDILAGPNKIFPYTIIMQIADGRWESIVTSSSTGTSKARNTHGFRLGQILLMYVNATFNENARVDNYTIWDQHTSSIDHRYSFNTTASATAGTIANKPIYIVGALNATDGLFYLDTKWWTQTLPSTDDGKLYIYIGDAYDYYRFDYVANHPIYWFKNGAVRLFAQDAATVTGHTVETDVPVDAVYDEFTVNEPYIYWNQLLDDTEIHKSGTKSSSVWVATSSHNFSLVEGHKYLLIRNGKYSDTANACRCVSTTSPTIVYNSAKPTGGTSQGVVFNCTESRDSYYIQAYVLANEAYDFYLNIFDLTAMFGSTIADYVNTLETQTAGSGIAWLKSYGFFTEEYYAYSANTMQSVSMSRKKNWSKNFINIPTTTLTSQTTLQGNIPLKAGTYTLSAHAKNNESITGRYRVIKTGTSNIYVSIDIVSGTNGKVSGIFTATEDTIVSIVGAGASAGYNFTLSECQLERGSVATEYSPYGVINETTLDHTTLRGIFKLDTNNNLYADGDTYESDGTVARKYHIEDAFSRGTVDSSGKLYKIATVNDFNYTGLDIKAICNLYPVLYLSDARTASDNGIKCVCLYGTSIYAGGFIGSESTLDSILPNLKIEYEVTTPTTETIAPYTSLQNIESGGTEEFIDYGVEQGTRDVAIPVGNESVYNNSKSVATVASSFIPNLAVAASKLSTGAGATNKPVYFNANGVASEIGYEVNKSVPSTADFNDEKVKQVPTTSTSTTEQIPLLLSAYTTATLSSDSAPAVVCASNDLYYNNANKDLTVSKLNGLQTLPALEIKFRKTGTGPDGLYIFEPYHDTMSLMDIYLWQINHGIGHCYIYVNVKSGDDLIYAGVGQGIYLCTNFPLIAYGDYSINFTQIFPSTYDVWTITTDKQFNIFYAQFTYCAGTKHVTTYNVDLPQAIENGAKVHRNIFRGKKLGTSISIDQYAAIEDGTFTDMFIGDYWEITEPASVSPENPRTVKFYIADFDPFLGKGSQYNKASNTSKHHIMLIPSRSIPKDPLTLIKPQDCSITVGGTEKGGYYNSIFRQNMSTVNTYLYGMFGEDHILKHEECIQDTKYASTYSFDYADAKNCIYANCTAELLSQNNVFGHRLVENGGNGLRFYLNDGFLERQVPIFRHLGFDEIIEDTYINSDTGTTRTCLRDNVQNYWVVYYFTKGFAQIQNSAASLFHPYFLLCKSNT